MGLVCKDAHCPVSVISTVSEHLHKYLGILFEGVGSKVLTQSIGTMRWRIIIRKER